MEKARKEEHKTNALEDTMPEHTLELTNMLYLFAQTFFFFSEAKHSVPQHFSKCFQEPVQQKFKMELVLHDFLCVLHCLVQTLQGFWWVN